MKENYRNHREERLKNSKEYQKIHKKEKAEYDKKRRNKLAVELEKMRKENDDRACVDIIKGDKCTYGALKARKRYHEFDYEGINPKDCIIEPSISFEEFQKLDESTQQSLRNSVIKKLESIYPNLFTSQSADPTIFDL